MALVFVDGSNAASALTQVARDSGAVQVDFVRMPQSNDLRVAWITNDGSRHHIDIPEDMPIQDQFTLFDVALKTTC